MACAQVFWRKPPNGKFIAGIRTPVPLSLSQPKPSQPAHKAWHWIWDHKLSWYSDIFNSCTRLGIIFSRQPKSVWGRSTPVACLVSSQYPSVNPKSLQQALLLLLMKRMTINASLELIITNHVLSLCHILLTASKKGQNSFHKISRWRHQKRLSEGNWSENTWRGRCSFILPVTNFPHGSWLQKWTCL